MKSLAGLIVAAASCMPPAVPMTKYPTPHHASSEFDEILPSVRELWERKFPGTHVLRTSAVTDRWKLDRDAHGIRTRTAYVDLAFADVDGTCFFTRRDVYSKDDLGRWGELQIGPPSTIDGQYRKWYPDEAPNPLTKLFLADHEYLPIIDCAALR
jgi:hypothetical protein